MACYFGGESENGEILYDLVIRQNHAADIHKPYLVLERVHPDADTLPNFRQGDAIVLYERNVNEDNVTNKWCLKEISSIFPIAMLH